MSDLQCPARFLLVAPAASAAERLRHERVAAVYAGPDGSASADELSAEELGRALGAPVRRPGPAVDLGAVLAREPGPLAALEDLADLHRGETVVVVAAGPPDRDVGRDLVEVLVDADGITVR